ncbi:centrosomal protein of 170 kDa protein B isoform X2 [Trematomus bernacchii]|uniref:centrosomal protein of 170 kDa protein B isoform X2 n=1 Tax=Trematomus bernacchii TaxID=40690 RepID=UPI00146D6626|nr:centrosomal protein of 170 kDa protein B isoform X2 [Trematomus bernacchii]
MSVTSWFLVSSSGTRHRLPREMIFVGRDDCELILQSRSVDKQHAVINYDQNTDEHMVKDLGSLNGTFVNDLRIPDQTYITLKLSDVIRFGYDAHVYILERSQHKVPEEALKHEKYTSQLQLSIKVLQAKAKEKQQLQSSEKSKSSVSKLQDKAEQKAQSLTASTESPISKPTPLYGQPSWWGEDEEAAIKSKNRGGKSPEQESPEPAKDVSRYEVNGSLSESQTKSILSYRREPSYFEIPTKELHQRAAKKPETQVHEVPTKDTPNPADIVPSTPPVVQSHASFTIEFDECTPGKMKIKDHVTKFSFRQQHKLPSTEHVTAPTEVISAESKVADWLVQSNASMIRRKSMAEELYGTNGDSSPLRITKANHSEDDTHVESRDPAINGRDFLQSDPLSGSHVSPQPLRASPPQRLASPDSEEVLSRSPPEPQSLSSLGKAEPHQAFVIEFFDGGPRKKRSQSFTNNPSPPESSCLRVPLDKVKKSSSPAVERRGPPPASTTTPTKRYTVPLKGPSSTGFQRAGSLRREKTDDRMSTSYSSRSSSSVSARPFSSVGRRSKLAQEFNAEFLKQAKQSSSASWEDNASSPPTAAKTEAVAISQSSPAPSKAPCQPQTSSPIHQPVALKAPVMAPVTQSVEVTSPTVGPKHEEEDSLSDAGTYTIEADIQDKELEEARTKIDQSPERTKQTEADSSSEFSPVLVESREQHRQSSCGEVRPAPEQGQSLLEVQAAGAVLRGAPKWMSCWASLADSYTESGPSSGLFDISSQMELSAGARGSITNNATLSRHNDSADSDGSRARRILPQVPHGEKSDIPTPSIHVHYDPHLTFNVGERGLATPRFQEGLHRLSVQDDVEPDSLSDASKSDDGSIVEQKRRQPSDTEEKTTENKLSTKSTSFYIGSEESQPDRGGSNSSTEKRNGTKMFSTATLTKPKGSPDSGKIKPTLSAPVLNQSSESEGSVSPLIRQESYTKERPSNARLPNISILSLQRESESFQGAVNQDTHSYLKDTEDVLAALEAKLQAGQLEKTPSPVMDFVSTESDVDTSSTVSQHSNNTRSNILTSKVSASGLHRERSSGSIASQDSSYQSTTSEKMRSLGADSNNQTGFFRRPVGLRRSVGKHGSTDLSDDPQSLPYSDQESNSYQTRKKYTVPLQKEDSKTTRTSMALSRANSLTAPRPTRASMLRRARLGEASDNEGTETDRMSQEAGNAPAKQPQETKKLSRLDMLAMPRKRTGSFNTPSDTESSSAPSRSGFSNRSTELGGSSARRASTSGLKPAEKQQKAPPNKAPLTRGRSSSAKYTGSTTSSRRRQKGSDYASTSDEEYDSNQSTPKHKRSQPSSATHSPRHHARPQPVVALRPKPRSRDSEDENNEGEAYTNWTNHSSEIARLSQDLAKDLAILAREIHDVAGDGDPTHPAEEISAPVSAVTAHEQLVHHIPEAGLNYQRVPPNSAPPREPEQSCSDPEVSSRPRARSRDEVTVDNLMLNPVSQITMAIRENTEQLADKIKLLFQDRVDIWEEIDAKVNSDNDVPVVKSANKEITSILKELRRVQRQLEVINTVMEPSGQLEASRASASSSSGVQPSRPPASRDWRTVHSASRRGGGPRPSESVRRAAVTPDDVRAAYLV